MTKPSAFDLSGRRAVITGGTQGVGAAIAVAMADSGADVCLLGLQHDAAAAETQRRCRSYGVACEVITTDMASPPGQWLPSLMDRIDSQFGNVDSLVNNAGTYRDKPFLEMDFETFDQTFQLNVASGYFLTQAFARRWVRDGVGGRIVFTGSINGFLAENDHTAYDASKGAVAAMVRSLCVSLAPHNIRVNSMAPGLVVTPLTDIVDRDANVRRWMEMHTPNGQVPGPEVCGHTVVFLLSDAAAHIHGQTILVDGGMSAWQQPDPPATP